MITVFKVIFGAIKFFFKAVYAILKFLRIRLLALYLIVCGLMQLTFHTFNDRGYVFWIGFGICAFLTLFSWAMYIRHTLVKRPVRREPKSEDIKEEKKKVKKKRAPRRGEQPKFFNVAGREGYVFAEYSDRYELYFKGEDGYMLVRTDYKQSEKV